MRVWLIEEAPGQGPGALEIVVRQLAERWANRLVVLGIGPLTPERLSAIRREQPDILVVQENSWPGDSWLEELQELPVAVIVATTIDRSERFQPLAERHPLFLVSPQATLDELGLAFVGALAGQRRHAYWKGEVERLTQRLNDRIIIERAKGILVLRLGISEDEAYERLRVLARRQRRQMRDIAQSVLDAQLLMTPDADGDLEHTMVEARSHPEKPRL